MFDIGAHYGESIDKFQRHCGAGLVVSVEPCFESYRKLVETIAREKYNAVALHAAAWSGPGITQIRRAANQDGLSTIHETHKQWEAIYPEAGFEAPQPVAMVTVDMLKNRYGDPEYVKIDTEGCELQVMMGMKTCRPRVLTFEFHRESKEDAVRALSLLAVERGYTHATLIEDDVDPSKWPDVPLIDFVEQFERKTPQWGNITVCRPGAYTDRSHSIETLTRM